MKLFIWADPYIVHYGNSMLIAVAENEEDARKIAEGATLYKYIKFRDGNASQIALGAPTRVVSLPCAEWHEWSE